MNHDAPPSPPPGRALLGRAPPGRQPPARPPPARPPPARPPPGGRALPARAPPGRVALPARAPPPAGRVALPARAPPPVRGPLEDRVALPARGRDGNSTQDNAEATAGMRRVFRSSDLLTETVARSHKIGRVLSWRSVGSFWLGEARKRSASVVAALAAADAAPKHPLGRGGGGGDTESSSEEDSEWEEEREEKKEVRGGVPVGMERMPSLTDSRILHTQNWKWLDEEDLAHHLAANAYQKAAKEISTPEKEEEGKGEAEVDLEERIILPEDDGQEEDEQGKKEGEEEEKEEKEEEEDTEQELESKPKGNDDADARRYAPDIEYQEADVFGTPQISGLPRNSITQYDTHSRFLRAGVLTLRSSLLRNSTLIVDKSGADVAFTRSCMERARAAEEVVSLLDRVSSLLPTLSTSVSASTALSPDCGATQSSPHGFGDIPDGTAGAMIHRRAVAMEKAKGLRKAHSAYANRSRQWARSRMRQIQTHASRNRSKYYETRKRGTKTRAASSRQQAHTQASPSDAAFSPLAAYEAFEAHVGSLSAPSLSSSLSLSSPPPLSSPSVSSSSSSSSLPLPLLKQHRTDRIVENRRQLLQREWEENVNVDMRQPGSPGVDRPRLVRKGERALSPSLAASPSSSKFLLSMSESSPSLGRQTATVPIHFVPGLRTAGALEAAHPHGYQGRHSNTLLRAVPQDCRDHLIRIALVEFREKVSQLKTQRWKDLETVLERCEFEKRDATPAPTDAASVRRVVRQLLSSRRVSSVAKLRHEKGREKKKKDKQRQKQAPRQRTQMPMQRSLTNLERGTTSPVVSASALASLSLPASAKASASMGGDAAAAADPKTFHDDDYVPYAMRKSPEKAAAANVRTQSLVQRQVARHDRMVAERTFRTARRTAKEFQSLEKADFERSVHRTLKDRSWDRDYETAIASSRSFMGERNAEVRKLREEERLRLKRERKAASIASTAIPQDYQNRELLRREIRRQARLELTQVEVEEVERLWAQDNYPNRQPLPVGRVRRKGGVPTARERVAAEIEKAMERRRQERAAGPRYPSYPTDPGEYAHLFDNESTNYDPSDSERMVSADGYSEASSFDERFDLPL